MSDPVIPSAKVNTNYPNRKKSRRATRKFIPILSLMAVIFFVAFAVSILFGPSSVVNYIFHSSTLKSTNDRVNVLLLGIAGQNHDGPNLTDTIVVASYHLKTNQLDLISLPRDFWIDSIKGRANSVYEMGLNRGAGLSSAKQVIGNVLGLPIHYGLRVDFNGFIKAIDTVGGIDLSVETEFNDYHYPLAGEENNLCDLTSNTVDLSAEEAQKYHLQPGPQQVFVNIDGTIATDTADPNKELVYFRCRFEHLHFDAGSQHMDGATALKFVRSRKGTNGEGSDFARAKRQQKVIEAARNKGLSLQTLTSPDKISTLASTFGQSLDSDIPLTDLPKFIPLVKNLSKTNNLVLDNSVQLGLLTQPNPADFGGAFVLIPKAGVSNYDNIQRYIKDALNKKPNESTPAARTGTN
ncbi:MAG: LCP family protein [Candidatus Daviesbacteria bacterium]|nr:MAG: LCP family protein [Candidatus Daviesbacteria bacterium]